MPLLQWGRSDFLRINIIHHLVVEDGMDASMGPQRFPADQLWQEQVVEFNNRRFNGAAAISCGSTLPPYYHVLHGIMNLFRGSK